MSFIQKILGELDSLIIVKDNFGNIVWFNNKLCIDLFNVQDDNQIKYNNKYYECKKKRFIYDDNEYFLYEYVDITNKIIKIEKLEKDYLTGLYNRHKIAEKINEIIEKSKEKDSVFSIVIGDIDFFKKVNDNYGHLIGDMVLKYISNFLTDYIGINGTVGRYGGEEFIIILPEFTEDDAYLIMEEVRKNICDKKIYLENDYLNVSMTFGITSSFGEKSLKELIKEADYALYEGKNNGRNKTMIYTE